MPNVKRPQDMHIPQQWIIKPNVIWDEAVVPKGFQVINMGVQQADLKPPRIEPEQAVVVQKAPGVQQTHWNIFVYDNLLSGLNNQNTHPLLKGSEFVFGTIAFGHYYLYVDKELPIMVHHKNCGNSVHGEVWMVDKETLNRLDEYMLVGDVKRKKIHCKGLEGVYSYLVDADKIGLDWKLLPTSSYVHYVNDRISVDEDALIPKELMI